MDQTREDPRVTLSTERTLLAWVRTGLALMGLGFVVARFGVFIRQLGRTQPHRPLPEPTVPTLWAGTALLLCGVLTLILAAAGYRRFIRLLREGRRPATISGHAGVVLEGLLAALGVALAVYLIAAG
jgi:putative membrane protein